MADDWDPFADPADSEFAPAPLPGPSVRHPATPVAVAATLPAPRQSVTPLAAKPQAKIRPPGEVTNGMAVAKPKDDKASPGPSSLPLVSGPAAVQAPGSIVYPSPSMPPASKIPAPTVKADVQKPQQTVSPTKGDSEQPRPRQAFSKAVEQADSKGGPKPNFDNPMKQSEESIKMMLAEIERLKLTKAKAVEEEEFEEAGMLKRRIKVLEDSIGDHNKAAEMVIEAKEKAQRQFQQEAKPKAKMKSEMAHGESLIEDRDIEGMRLMDDEATYIKRKREAMKERNVTDNTEQGVPQWAFEDIKATGPTGVKTSRPSKLTYQFKGAIEDDKWEEGALFQTSFVCQVPVDMAFGFVANADRSSPLDGAEQLAMGPGSLITHFSTGIAQLQETSVDEVIENQIWVAWIIVHKPRVPGKVKLEAARTVTSKAPFHQRPFYTFKSLWRFRPGPGGGTHVTRGIFDFKQYELLDFDALNAVSRTIEIENERMRMSWSSAVAIVPDKSLAIKGASAETLARRSEAESDMYSASFVVDGNVERVFEAMVGNEVLYDYHAFLADKSYLRVDEHQSLLRQVNGIVLLNSTRVSDSSYTVTTLGHLAGRSIKAAQMVTKPQQVVQDHFYRVSTEWSFSELSETETTIRRTMVGFKQIKLVEEMPDLANVITEAADIENRKIIDYFRAQNVEAGGVHVPRPQTAISMRANYAMRAMPELLDHAAKNHVLEVREMLEVRGADPNYIHVRTDAWTVSDSRIEFYEEITPLVVAAERGATDVMKVLFNHPQLDVNLCCCAFNDMEIYNYYTAYDMTMSRKHPHAAALLRARGVLPASSEHVFKPPFDRVHMRPLREDMGNVYGNDDEYGEGEMPAWDTIAEGNPKLARALESAANTLSMSKVQNKETRTKIFKDLIANWHPDRHATTNLDDIATKVFQWLQVVKKWYLDEAEDLGSVNMPLPDNPEENPADIDTGRGNAREHLHPSGSVFSVW